MSGHAPKKRTLNSWTDTNLTNLILNINSHAEHQESQRRQTGWRSKVYIRGSRWSRTTSANTWTEGGQQTKILGNHNSRTKSRMAEIHPSYPRFGNWGEACQGFSWFLPKRRDHYPNVVALLHLVGLLQDLQRMPNSGLIWLIMVK